MIVKCGCRWRKLGICAFRAKGREFFGVDDGKGIGLGTPELTCRKASKVLNLIIWVNLHYVKRNTR